MTSSVTLSGNNQKCSTTDSKTTINDINIINNNCNNNSYNNSYVNSNEIAITSLSTLNTSDIVIDVDLLNYGHNCLNASLQAIKTNPQMLSSSCVPSSTGTNPPFITIPFGWKRELNDSKIVYYSPTNCCLHSIDELSKYLESDGTCKCGLECPLFVSKTFNFDPSIPSKPYDIEVAKNSNQNKLCNHKRKIIALATFHTLKEHSIQTQLFAQQNQLRLHQKHSDSDNELHYNYNIGGKAQHISSGDNQCAQTNDFITVNVTNSNPNSCQLSLGKYSSDHMIDGVSVIHSNHIINKSTPGLIQTVINGTSVPNCSNERQALIGSQQQYIEQSANCDNRCHYSVPISAQTADGVRNCDTHPMALQIGSGGVDHMPPTGATNQFCLYDNSCNTGFYSFSACDSGNNKTSIYLTPQQPTNYSQMVYENGNVNLIQPSHSQPFNSDNYSHAFNNSESICSSNPTMTGLQSYIPLHSPNSANTGAISFNASPLSTTAINLNSAYHSGLHTPHDSSQCHTQNNISILPQNPPMPPLSVPNVTTVTTSMTDVIPAVGVAPQMMNSGNPSGAPQVIQFINSVPLTQISANTVTVLQQATAPEVSVPATTLIIPQLMSPHEHSVVINHAMGPQTTMFPHIATATGLTALPNAFQNAISIANAISLPQRNCIPETGKQFTRTRKRKEYNRTNRTHPPTVASILKQVADNEKKQKELNNEKHKSEELPQKEQELQTTNSDTSSQTDESVWGAITE